MQGFIYMTTNLVNGMKYIGKCEYARLNGWEDYLGSGKILKQAIKKYGKDNFHRDILIEATTAEELDKLEQYYIGLYDACNSNEFYNIATGGDGGNTRLGYTEEQYQEYCKKFSRPKELNGMYGRTHSEKSKKQDGEKTSKRFQDEAFRTKHSEAVKEAMKKVDKSKLAFSSRKRNVLMTCKLCGKEEYVYTSQQTACSECKKKYTRWQLSCMIKNC